jgi:hypothetical protein
MVPDWPQSTGCTCRSAGRGLRLPAERDRRRRPGTSLISPRSDDCEDFVTSGHGTKRSWRCSHRMSVVGGKAEDIYSGRVFRILPSRPGEFHPEPLTDPDLILSHHPARAIAQSLSASTERKAPPGYARLAQISCDDLPPSLQPHYRAFVTTTRQSAPLRRIGTFGLTVIAA